MVKNNSEVVSDGCLRPRLCQLILSPDFDGYGFNLHAEKSRPGQYVGKVDDGSPAAFADLREGDRIIEVNGVNIAEENHKQVVNRIKSVPKQTELLVVDKETDRIYKERGEVIKSHDAIKTTSRRNQESKEESQKIPDGYEVRRCQIRKGKDGFGFSVQTIKKNNVQFIREVIPGSPAETAGLRVNDVIIEINGVNIKDETHQQAINRITAVPDNTTLLVADPDAIEYFRKNNIVITGRMSNIIDNQGGEEEEEEDDDVVVVKEVEEEGLKEAMEVRVENVDNVEQVEYDLSENDDECNVIEVEAKVSEIKTEKSTSSTIEIGSNGNSISPRSTPSPDIPSPSPSTTTSAHNGLNLNMTAAEMRQKIVSKKKRDPRKDDRMDIRRKYEIIQTL